jgi:fatty-acyl-CoA synthase
VNNNSATGAVLTPLSFLKRSSMVWATKPAYVFNDDSVTYAEFAAQAEDLAGALVEWGLQPGDRVAYMMPNVPEMLIAHFGVPLAKCVLVPINIRLSSSEVSYILEHSGARVCVFHSSLSEVVKEAAREVTNVEAWISAGGSSDMGAGTECLTYQDFAVRRGDFEADYTVDDELNPISINYTSGTTGRPKGVVYTHRGAYLNSLGELLHSRFSPESVYLWTLPMFHCNGWCTTWAVTGIGGTHVCLSEVRPDQIWQEIRDRSVTHMNAAPTVITAILNHPDAVVVSPPIALTTAGASPSPTVIAQAEAHGFSIIHVYGLTEVYGPHSICEVQPEWAELDDAERARMLARQGVPMIQATEMRVVTEDMRDVPADGETLGEIVMRGNNVMLGYFRDDEATAQAFRGGWFHSGDLGVMYPDGYVALKDRLKDIIISGGENISTVEVEQAIASHPAVLEVAVIGVPDEKWGERPKAFVVLKDLQVVSDGEIIDHVRTQIAHFKAPRDVHITESLPKTSTGKIKKYALREVEWSGARG